MLPKGEPMRIKPSTTQTHVVIKLADLLSFCTGEEQAQLSMMLRKIEKGREKVGKTGNNIYMVVNTDEPYAEEVWKVIQLGEENKNDKGTG